MDQNTQTIKNTEDINKLAIQMASLIEITKNSEKRHDDVISTLKDAILNIQKLNERVGNMVAMEKDISTLKEDIAELKADARVNRHDLVNALNAQQALPKMVEDISTLKTWKNQIEGGTKASKFIFAIIWLLLGGVIVGGAQYVLFHGLKSQIPYPVYSREQ